MKKVLKFVKGKKNNNINHNSTTEIIKSVETNTTVNSNDSQVSNEKLDHLSDKPTYSQSSSSNHSNTDDYYNNGIVEQLNNLSEHLEKSLQEDTISVLSLDKHDSSLTSTSPQSAVIPPPCKPLRSLEYLHTENSTKTDFQDVKSNLVVLGTVRTRHISFTETPALSNNRLSYHNDITDKEQSPSNPINHVSNKSNHWSSEKNLPISLARTTYHVKTSPLKHPNQHFKRYSLDYNFKTKFPLIKPDALPISEDCLQTEFEQLETYDDALKHLEKCDLEKIHHKSRSLPRTTDISSNFDSEFKSNSMSLPRSLTMNDENFASICDCPLSRSFCDHDHFGILFIKKPLFKHFKNIFDYKKNLKRGRKLVKSFSFSSKSTESGCSEGNNNRFSSRTDDVRNDKYFIPSPKDFKMAPDQQNVGISNPKINDYTSSTFHKNSTKTCCATRIKEQELEKEVIRWKKQFSILQCSALLESSQKRSNLEILNHPRRYISSKNNKRYNDVLKKIETIDADAKTMESLLHSSSTQLTNGKTNNDFGNNQLTRSPSEGGGQIEVSEVVNILQQQYDKVENVLLKQNDKLETIVHKLNAELETTKLKELELERQLKLKNNTDMIEITISDKGMATECSVTLVMQQNEIIQKGVDVLKNYIQDHNTELEVFSIQMGSGQSIYERLAILEKENRKLKLKNTTVELENISTQTSFVTPDETKDLINVLNILENQIKNYEETSITQQNEIVTQKTIVENLTDTIKTITDEKHSLMNHVLELKRDLQLIDDQRIVINNYNKEVDRLRNENTSLIETNKQQQLFINEQKVTNYDKIESNEIFKKLQDDIEIKDHIIEKLTTEMDQQKLEFKNTKEINKELELQMIDLIYNKNTLERELEILREKLQFLDDEKKEQKVFEMSHILRKMQSQNNDLKFTVLQMKKSFDQDTNLCDIDFVDQLNNTLSLKSQSLPVLNSKFSNTFSIQRPIEQKLRTSRSNSMPNMIVQKNDKKLMFDKSMSLELMYPNSVSELNNIFTQNERSKSDLILYDNNNLFAQNISEYFCKNTMNKSFFIKKCYCLNPQLSKSFDKSGGTKINDWKCNLGVNEKLSLELAEITRNDEHTKESQTNNLDENDFQAVEKKLRLQFENTRCKLENELKTVQMKLNEKYKLQQKSLSTKCSEFIINKSNRRVPTLMPFRPVALQDTTPFCIRCTGIISKNKNLLSKYSLQEKKICTCGETSIALQYRLQLNETIERNRASIGSSKTTK